MIPRIATHPEAFRVFRGYKKPDLEEDQFLELLGNVFMPGTPLMLRDLGLAAYLPVVLPQLEDPPDVPDEVAIIAYASPERYQYAREVSITGRMYTPTHYAVFDMSVSRSQAPAALGAPVDPVTAFWCAGEACDWQGDGEVVVWAGHAGGVDGAFPARFLEAVGQAFPALQQAGARECVGQVGPTWASLWLLFDGFLGSAAAERAAQVLRPGPAGSSELLLETATRLIWRDQPPPADVTRPSAWSFVFVREPSQFLT